MSHRELVEQKTLQSAREATPGIRLNMNRVQLAETGLTRWNPLDTWMASVKKKKSQYSSLISFAMDSQPISLA